MPLFRCTTCGCIENTALGMYWYNRASGKPVQCSECGKGKWHNQFPKKSAEGMWVDQEGYLWSQEEIDSGYCSHPEELIGRIAADGSIIPK